MKLGYNEICMILFFLWLFLIPLSYDIQYVLEYGWGYRNNPLYQINNSAVFSWLIVWLYPAHLFWKEATKYR